MTWLGRGSRFADNIRDNGRVSGCSCDRSAIPPFPVTVNIQFGNMPTPGYYFRDGGATPPPEENANSEFRQRISKATKPVTATAQAPLGQDSSTSHQLATGQHELRGAVQEAGKEDRTSNLGWQANAVGVDQLVGGLPNDELWTLVRRFNKVSASSLHPSTRSHHAASKCTMSKPFPSLLQAASTSTSRTRTSSPQINSVPTLKDST